MKAAPYHHFTASILLCWYKMLSFISFTNFSDDSGTIMVTDNGEKRKQSSGVKQEKQKAKRQKTVASSSSVICTSCKQTGHKSSRSPDCPNHMLSKNEIFSRNLGQQFKTYYQHMKQSIKTIMHMMLGACLCLGFFLHCQAHHCTGDLSTSA